MDAARRPGLGELGLVVLVTAIWGFNFVVIEWGLAGMPPLLLASLRFVLASLPAVFLVRPPAASWRLVAGYGLVLGVGEFAFLFLAMKLGAGAGLSSVVLQSQAVFTALLAWLFLGEGLRWHNWVGLAVAFAGMACIGIGRVAGDGAAAAMTPIGFGLLLLAALGWAGANLIARRAKDANAFSLTVWSSLFSPLPLFALSWAFEGPAAIGQALSSISWTTVGALAYLALISTLLGYGLWNHLIGRHGAATVAPFSLLVPVFGLASAALLLGERFSAVQMAAVAAVLAGLALHALGGRSGRRAKAPAGQ